MYKLTMTKNLPLRRSFFCVIIVLMVTRDSLCRRSYDGFQVLRVHPNHAKDIQWLLNVGEKFEADFWTEPASAGQDVDIMLPGHSINIFKSMLDKQRVEYSVMIDNIEGLIKTELHTNLLSTKNNTSNLFDYGTYHSYEEIRQWVTDFATEHKDIVTEFVVTKSYEGRDVAGVKISVPNGETKKSVWFEGGIHAREWISPATVLFMANQLVTDYKNGDAEAETILNNLDFYIVPVLNVDGYAFTWTNDRLWRKTRSPTWIRRCPGVDGNRNWPYEWGGVRASKNPCNETYRGSKAASEVEIQGVINFTMSEAQKQEFAVFIDWHSYSQAWMGPWSYSAKAKPPIDADDQLALGQAAIKAIRSVHKTIYRTGPASTTLYEASGFSIDWAYAKLKAKYSYCVELRDLGKYGFLLPADQIIPTGEECYAAVKVVGKWVVDEYKLGSRINSTN